MHRFQVGDEVVQNTDSKDLFSAPRKGVVVGYYPRRLFAQPVSVSFDGAPAEEVDEHSLSLYAPDGEVLLWRNSLTTFLATEMRGVIQQSRFFGKAFFAGGVPTPIRQGLSFTRVPSDYPPSRYLVKASRESTRFLCGDVRVREGDVVRKKGDRFARDAVVLWDYSAARWALWPVTPGLCLNGEEPAGLNAYPFAVVRHVPFIPPFEAGIPADERLFPSAQLLQALD
jgi:hypothetical protein